MRKFAKISGIITTLFVVVGICFKVLHYPGGSILVVIGTGSFSAIFLFSLAAYRLRNAKSTLEKVAAVLGWFGGSELAIGMLFKVQHWPGAAFTMLFGAVLSAVFLILHFVNLSKYESGRKKFGIFDVLIIVTYGMLFFGVNLAMKRNAETQMKIAEYETAFVAERKLNDANQELFRNIYLDTTMQGAYWSLNDLAESTTSILQYINELKRKVVAVSADVAESAADTLPIRYLKRLNDFDITTHLMIGNDTANVVGEAKTLNYALHSYFTNLMNNIPEHSQKELKSKITQYVPIDFFQKGRDQMVYWELGNFYHKTVLETLTTLTKLQTDILNAEKIVIEQIKNSSPK